MLISGSPRPFLLNENTPSFPQDPVPSEGQYLTLWIEIYCLALPRGSSGHGSRTPHHSTPQHQGTDGWISALTTAFFWLFSSLCKTHVWSQKLSVWYRRRSEVCLSFQGTVSKVHIILSDLSWVTHARSWGSSQLKLYQLQAWWFLNGRIWVQTFKVWALWAQDPGKYLNVCIHLIHV